MSVNKGSKFVLAMFLVLDMIYVFLGRFYGNIVVLGMLLPFVLVKHIFDLRNSFLEKGIYTGVRRFFILSLLTILSVLILGSDLIVAWGNI